MERIGLLATAICAGILCACTDAPGTSTYSIYSRHDSAQTATLPGPYPNSFTAPGYYGTICGEHGNCGPRER